MSSVGWAGFQALVYGSWPYVEPWNDVGAVRLRIPTVDPGDEGAQPSREPRIFTNGQPVSAMQVGLPTDGWPRVKNKSPSSGMAYRSIGNSDYIPLYSFVSDFQEYAKNETAILFAPRSTITWQCDFGAKWNV